MGFGPVIAEPNEPVFDVEWEKRALALTLAAGALGEWTIDMSRHARESLHPLDYLSSSYYELWVKGLEKLLIARGMATPEEVDGGRALGPSRSVRRLDAEGSRTALAKGTPYDRPSMATARFAVGDEVQALNIHPPGHTRLPRYVRGKRGRVEKVHGAFVFPDANAHGRGESPQWLYGVRFAGPELWGRDGDPKLDVSVDAWESYLEKASS